MNAVSLLFFLSFMMLSPVESFKQNQLSYSRVKNAYIEKEGQIEKQLKRFNIQLNSIEIFLRAFKHEKVLELWAKNKSDKKYQLINNYPFCATSGKLGPKRNKGDLQIPEGLYHIDRFNPQSKFHLSFGINYPNESDKKLGGTDPGGDIFIHGNCVTIGCIPITNDKIKEVYLYAVEAKNNGQKYIPVHIFPFKTTPEKWNTFEEKYSGNPLLISFWKSLNLFQSYFDEKKQLAKFIITPEGNYVTL